MQRSNIINQHSNWCFYELFETCATMRLTISITNPYHHHYHPISKMTMILLRCSLTLTTLRRTCQFRTEPTSPLYPHIVTPIPTLKTTTISLNKKTKKLSLQRKKARLVKNMKTFLQKRAARTKSFWRVLWRRWWEIQPKEKQNQPLPRLQFLSSGQRSQTTLFSQVKQQMSNLMGDQIWMSTTTKDTKTRWRRVRPQAMWQRLVTLGITLHNAYIEQLKFLRVVSVGRYLKKSPIICRKKTFFFEANNPEENREKSILVSFKL